MAHNNCFSYAMMAKATQVESHHPMIQLVIKVIITLSITSSETQGQLVEAGKSLNGREKFGQRKVIK